MPILGGTRSGGGANGDVTVLRQRLQQAYDVTCERSTGSKRWRSCRKLYRLTIIDAVGNGVIRATPGDSQSRDHQFGAAAAAVNGELRQGAIGAPARGRGGGHHRRIVYRRRGLADDPVVTTPRRANRRCDVTRQSIQAF